MGARIRLRRVGRKKQASYRIVVAEQSAARDGAYVEAIGFYNPRRQPAELRIDMERVDYWLSNGAQATETTAELIRKARKGGDAKVKIYTGDEQPEKETSPTAVRARRSARTKPKMKVAEATKIAEKQGVIRERNALDPPKPRHSRSVPPVSSSKPASACGAAISGRRMRSSCASVIHCTASSQASPSSSARTW